MKVDLTHIKTIHDLARTGSTGCRQDLAKRLGISIRSLSDLIRYMKEELDIPIHYDRLKLTYSCLEEGHVNFKFQRKRELKKQLMKLIEGALAMVVIYDIIPL
ncbi:hypothetical protein [Pedobacter hiemivivus]|uniref:Uncharacterized protein n=1 Tax=Pedobacter hiemivivus TaxID=2530454 RepID=A0A4R0NBT6_9SPHI|nr:hypothetical protein [Pedobacter hiemivivus]TCC97688.1 hypothetical protein EZ444_07160 [Pedobacter hiemivivus]